MADYTSVEDSDDHETQSDKHPRIPDIHLQSPIRRCTRESLFCKRAQNPSYINDIISSFPYKLNEVEIDSEFLYGYFYNKFMQPDINIMNWVEKNYVESLFCVIEVVNEMHKGLNLPPIQDDITLTHDDKIHLSELTRWCDIRDNMHSLRMERTVKWMWIVALPNGLSSAQICGHFMVFKTDNHPDQVFVFDYEQVMMLCDTLSARTMTLWYAHCISDDMPGKLELATIKTLYSIFDEDILERGNDAFATISMFEPICLAIMLSKYEEFSRSGSYLVWLKGELSSESHKSGYRVLVFLEESNLSCAQYSEIHGMFRHWGHPTVLESLGCEKVQSIGHSRSYPDLGTQRRMLGLMRRQFYVSFCSKHGRPPKIINPSQFIGKKIHALILSNGRSLNAYSPEYSLLDWGFIKFGKEFEFDYHADYTELIDDKALSPLRSEVRTAFCPEKLGYNPGRATTSRRVLEEVLNRSTIDIKDICDKVSTRTIPDDWKIIMLHAKERELKIAPRLFAMMVLEMRLYFCVTEANIAEFVFKYFPQQTMTLDESDLTKRLLYLADIMRDPERFLGLFNIVDFSSWNICHTHPMTSIFFQMLDELFDTPGLFFNTHWFFEQCMVCLASHMGPPSTLINNTTGDPPECNELWYEHCGGFEGLRQKGWTLITISLLLMVEHNVGMKGYIIGQGDNQICKIMIPVPECFKTVEEYLLCGGEDLDQKADLFLKTLTDIALKIGLIVKPEETCSSRNIIIYGKDIIYNGSFMPQAIKRISRTMPEVNEVYPTIETKIATIQTSGSSSSQKSLDYVVPYVISTTETLCSIMRDLSARCRRKQITREMYNMMITESFKYYILCSSSETSGCPILSPLSFLYRGHPDPVTCYLTFLDSIKSSIPMADRMYRYLQSLGFSIGQADPELLVSNPCSLNIRLPKTIGNLMRQELEKVLNRITINRDLSMIFNEQTTDLDKKFFQYLVKARPCHPRILHEIMKNSPIGSKLMYISKHKNTRTMRILFGQYREQSEILKMIDDMEISCIQFWHDMYKDLLKINLNKNAKYHCPTQLAQYLRDITWCDVTDGDPIEGVTIPHPAHQFTPIYLNDKLEMIKSRDIHVEGEHIMFTALSSLNKESLVRNGPYPHYIGSQTREKKSGAMYQIPYSGRPLESAQRLVQLNEWTISPESGLSIFIDELAVSRTNIPVDIIRASTKQIIGGSIVHRLDDHVTKRGTLNNIRPNITSNIYYSTDRMGRFSRGEENYNMHFQGAIHYGFTILSLSAAHEDPCHTLVLKLHYKASCCEERLVDFKLSCEETAPMVLNLKQNPLLFTNYTQALRLQHPTKRALVRIDRKSSASDAIGFLLFERFWISSNIYYVGISERSVPVSPNLGVAEIMGVGIQGALRSLAKYIYLHLPIDLEGQDNILHSMNPLIFSEIAQIMLLPELLPLFKLYLEGSYVPELFVKKEIACCIIKQTVYHEIIKIRGSEKLKLACTRLPLYTSHIIDSAVLFHFWVKQVWLSTKGLYNLSELMTKDITKTISESLQSAEVEDSIIKHITLKYGWNAFNLIAKICPMKISAFTPESCSRMSRRFIPLSKREYSKSLNRNLSQRMRRASIMPYVVSEDSDQTSLMCLQYCGQMITNIVPSGISRSVKTPRSRLDQSFRLFGEVSTSFFKISEILELKGIKIVGCAITLAEGEGSIARLLYSLGAELIYYNSLIDKSKLIPQRGYGYVPACMADIPSACRWTDICVMTGGDLTNPNTIQALLNDPPLLPVSVITCDAETTHGHTPILACKILNAWLIIANRFKAENGIFKTFCNDTNQLSLMCSSCSLLYHEVELITPCFSSHEIHEVYIVVRSPKKVVMYDKLFTALHKGRYIASSDYLINESALRIFRDKRLKPIPNQEKNWKFVEYIWKISPYIGFNDNAVNCLQKLTCHNHPYSSEKFGEWIKFTSDLAYRRTLSFLRSSASHYFGELEKSTPIEQFGKSHVIHNVVDKYCLCIIGCRILMECLVIDKDDAIEHLRDILSEPLLLVDQSREIYNYSVDSESWLGTNLRIFWRMWGHWRYNDKHQCSINW